MSRDELFTTSKVGVRGQARGRWSNAEQEVVDRVIRRKLQSEYGGQHPTLTPTCTLALPLPLPLTQTLTLSLPLALTPTLALALTLRYGGLRLESRGFRQFLTALGEGGKKGRRAKDRANAREFDSDSD